MNAKLISKFVAALQLGVLMMMFSACTFEITANPELEDAGYAEPEDTISVKLDDSSEISLDGVLPFRNRNAITCVFR